MADCHKDAMEKLANTQGPNIQNLHNQTSQKGKYIKRYERLLPAMWNYLATITVGANLA